MQKSLSLALLSTLAFSGCLTDPSESRKTEHIRVILVASKTGNGDIRLNVQAYDKLSALSWIDPIPFSSGDEFVVTDGSSTVRFRGNTGVLESDADRITVSLERAEGTDAPTSVMHFPEPFDLETIPAVVPRSENLTVGWNPAGNDTTSVDVDGDCIDSVYKSVGPGVDSVSLSIEARENLDPGVSCRVELSVTRSRRGTVDKSFGDGSKSFGRQVRHATFKSVP